jgi:RimJ/RimL family protein N-acetyltransferase
MPEIPVGTDAMVWVKEKLDNQPYYLCHVLEDIHSSCVIGFVQLSEANKGTLENKLAIELGYFIFPEFWAKGYGSELIQALIKNIVEPNNWSQEVIAWVYDGNVASIKLLEKCNFFKACTAVDANCNKSMFVYQSSYLKNMLSELA